MRRRVRKSPHTSFVVVGDIELLRGLAAFRVAFWGSFENSLLE
jgi:hypothetical protein